MRNEHRMHLGKEPRSDSNELQQLLLQLTYGSLH